VPRGARRRGLTLVDLLAIVFLMGLLVLFLLMAVPRGREQARLAACQKNLSQIGMALALYDQTQHRLPTTPPPEPIRPDEVPGTTGPLRILLETFGLSDFRDLAAGGALPEPAGPVPGAVPVPGFVCPSDPEATSGSFHAPVSYRACTGSDQFGSDGAFAPGRTTSLSAIERGKGTAYVVAFSERLVGDNQERHTDPRNYALVKDRLPEDGCTIAWLRDREGKWHGDAGATWRPSDYRFTLYNHSLPPNGRISCLSVKENAAFMGASSGHVRGVGLLMLDGSVKPILPSVNPVIWRGFAATASPETPDEPQPR
jgi:hypothetical protein